MVPLCLAKWAGECLIHQGFSETERDLHKLHLLKADLTTLPTASSFCPDLNFSLVCIFRIMVCKIKLIVLCSLEPFSTNTARNDTNSNNSLNLIFDSYKPKTSEARSKKG